MAPVLRQLSEWLPARCRGACDAELDAGHLPICAIGAALARAAEPVATDGMRRVSHLASDLADPDVMRQAWS